MFFADLRHSEMTRVFLIKRKICQGIELDNKNGIEIIGFITALIGFDVSNLRNNAV